MLATNKLTVYLIKDKFKSGKTIIKNANKPIVIPNSGTFYTEDSFTKEPSWIEKFFKSKLRNVSLFVASAKGVFLPAPKLTAK